MSADLQSAVQSLRDRLRLTASTTLEVARAFDGVAELVGVDRLCSPPEPQREGESAADYERRRRRW